MMNKKGGMRYMKQFDRLNMDKLIINDDAQSDYFCNIYLIRKR